MIQTNRNPMRRSARWQIGAIGVLNVFVMAVAVSALGVLGIGQTVWEKQRLQNLADQVAITAARQINDAPAWAEARALATLNGLKAGDQLTIDCMINGAATTNCAEAVTVRATIQRTVTPFFLASTQNMTATAEATNAPIVAAMISSNLASLDSSKSALLNGLLGTLGGGAVNLTVADYQGLLGANVKVDLVQLALELGVASTTELLNLNLTALTLLNEGLAIGQGSATDKSKFQGALGLAGSALNRVSFKVSDILALSTNPGTVNGAMPFLNVNLGELAQAALLRSVQGKSYNLNVTSGLLGVTVGLTVLQPPQIFVGRKLPFKSPISQGSTAQIALDVRAQQTLNLVVASAGFDIGIQLKLAGGVAQIDDVTCNMPRANNVTTMTVQPSLLDLCIASSSSNLKTTVGNLTCGPAATVATVSLLGIPIGVKLGASASLRPNPTTLEIDGAAPPAIRMAPVSLNTSQTLANLMSNLSLNVQLDIPLVGPLLNALLSPLINTLLATLNPLLSPLLGAVGGILDGVLALLGISLNQVTPTLLSVDCSNAVLTR